MTELDKFKKESEIVKGQLNAEDRHDFYIWQLNETLTVLVKELKLKSKEK